MKKIKIFIGEINRAFNLFSSHFKKNTRKFL